MKEYKIKKKELDYKMYSFGRFLFEKRFFVLILKY